MKPRMMRPYTITSISETGNLFLRDRFSHDLKKSIHPSQAIEFFENSKMQNIKLKDCQSDFNEMSDFEDNDLIMFVGCQQTHGCKSKTSLSPLTSIPIKSQIIIMSNQEMPLSSDDSESIDVVNDRYVNPWGNMTIDKILLEIVRQSACRQ